MWDKTVHDFGNLLEFSKHVANFKYRGKLNITGVKTSCGCTVVNMIHDDEDDLHNILLNVRFSVPEREYHFDLNEEQHSHKTIRVTYEDSSTEILDLKCVIMPNMDLKKYKDLQEEKAKEQKEKNDDTIIIKGRV